MTGKLHVEKLGGRLLVVDGGPRAGSPTPWPTGGAFDLDALAAGNHTLAQPWWTCGLELLLGPLTLRAEGGDVDLAVSGPGPITLRTTNGPQRVDQDADETGFGGHAFRVQAGDAVTIGPSTSWLRRTIAVRGGVSLSPGTSVGVGHHTTLAPSTPAPHTLTTAPPVRRFPVIDETWGPAPMADGITLRCTAGSNALDEILTELRTAVFRVSATSDRRGVRLDGAITPPTAQANTVSCGAWPGTVQWLPGGALTILGPDSVTSGGYARLAHVISADRALLARVRPGQLVRWQPISMTDAQALRRQWEAWCRRPKQT